jgi:transposase-like protein
MPTPTSTATQRCRTSTTQTRPPCRTQTTLNRLTGFPDAIEAVFPKTTVQTCIVHLIRASLKYVPRREREQVARDLKPIYTAKDADQAHAELETFDEKWGARFPVITAAGRSRRLW